MSAYDQCPGSRRIKKPFPEEFKCSCGNVVEIWSDEAGAICKKCKKELTREMLPSCLDWCSMARECVGDVKYKRYLASRKIKKGREK